MPVLSIRSWQEAEHYLWFSLTNFSVPTEEIGCIHSKAGSENTAPTELEILKSIHRRQHKNPQHICHKMKAAHQQTQVPLAGIGFYLFSSCFSVLAKQPGLLMYYLFSHPFTSHLFDSMQTNRQILLQNKEIPTGTSYCDFSKLQGSVIWRGKNSSDGEGEISCVMNSLPLLGVGKCQQVRGELGVWVKQFLLVLSGFLHMLVLQSVLAPQAVNHGSTERGAWSVSSQFSGFWEKN